VPHFCLCSTANPLLVRRHWQPRVLRGHAVCLLRPHPSRPGSRVVVA
jgi:hypothetical protein